MRTFGLPVSLQGHLEVPLQVCCNPRTALFPYREARAPGAHLDDRKGRRLRLLRARARVGYLLTRRIILAATTALFAFLGPLSLSSSPRLGSEEIPTQVSDEGNGNGSVTT